MPYSDTANREFVLEFVQDNNIKSVLDIGAGSGTYGDLLRDHVEVIDAIEIWEPYVEQFGLREKYREVGLGDVIELFKIYSQMYELFPVKIYDLIIFGDVLEHMTERDSMFVWDFAGKIAEWRMLSSPIIHYPQGEEFGNPYERHVQESVNADDIRRIYGPFDFEQLYDATGTFIRGPV